MKKGLESSERKADSKNNSINTLIRIFNLIVITVFGLLLFLPCIEFNVDLNVSHWGLFALNNGWTAIPVFMAPMIIFIIVDEVLKLTIKKFEKGRYAQISSVVKLACSVILLILCVVPVAVVNQAGMDFMFLEMFFILITITLSTMECIKVFLKR